MIIAALSDEGHAKSVGALPGARIFAINNKSLKSLKIKSSGHISSILKKSQLPFTLSLQIVATAAPTKLAITGLTKFKDYQEYQKKEARKQNESLVTAQEVVERQRELCVDADAQRSRVYGLDDIRSDNKSSDSPKFKFVGVE